MINAINKYQNEILKALFETFQMVVVAMIFSLIFGLLIGFVLYLTRKNGIKENKIIYTIISTIINILRSVPYILLIIIIIPFNRWLIGTGFGVYASMIPLSIIGIATFARFTEQSLLETSSELYETSYALGSNDFQFLKDFLLVEAKPSLILNFTQTTISLLAYSTVMGVIAGGGLGYLAIKEGYENFNYNLMWIIIIIMIIIVQIVQLIGSMIARKTDRK